MKPWISPRVSALAAANAMLVLLLVLLIWFARATLGVGGAFLFILLGGALAVAGLGLILLEQRARLRVDATLKGVRAQLDRAHEDVRRIDQDMQRLAQLSGQLQSCRSLEEIGQVLGVAMRDVMPQFDGALYLQAPGRNVLNRLAGWGKPDVLEEMFGLDDCWAIRRGMVYPADEKSPGCKHLGAEATPEHALCAPLKAVEANIGVLHFAGSAVPTAGERRLAQNIADQLALTIANLRLRDLLRVQQVRDPLTGLFNRRALDEILLRECLKARRRNKTVAVLMLDLDHFRRFVEKHGHEAGDVALTQIASQVAQTIRHEDIACRFGGEEFVVIMPEADDEIAREQADSIRRAVKAAHIDFHGRRLEVITISIGIALFPMHGAEPVLCLRAADKALNAAKEAGRDRVEIAEASEPTTAGSVSG